MSSTACVQVLGISLRVSAFSASFFQASSIILRIDPAVLEALQKWAGDDLRSLNAQIEFVLRDALARAGREPKPRKKDGGPYR